MPASWQGAADLLAVATATLGARAPVNTDLLATARASAGTPDLSAIWTLPQAPGRPEARLARPAARTCTWSAWKRSLTYWTASRPDVETCVGAVIASSSRRSLETEFSGGPVQLRRAGKRDIGGLRLNPLRRSMPALRHTRKPFALSASILPAWGSSLAVRAGEHPYSTSVGRTGRQLFIGEVKSLRSTNQDQQIRLGVGQLLDYAHQMGGRHASIRPVLVLERRPTDGRWAGLAAAHNILFTHGPNFPGV